MDCCIYVESKGAVISVPNLERREKVKNKASKIVVGVLAICLLVVPFEAVYAEPAMPDSGIVMPLYNNVVVTACSMNISDSGMMIISYMYSGYEGVTSKAVITTYIEKKVLGLFWQRVDIGTINNVWSKTINEFMYTGSRYYQLSSTGTYRVNVKYEIYGSGGDVDVISYEKSDTY